MEYVLHMSYMTGDIFGITAAMALNPNLRIVFAHGSETDKEYQQNRKFYQACGLWKDVLKHDIRTKQPSAKPKEVYAAIRDRKGSGPTTSKAADYLLSIYPNVREVHEVTQHVAEAYKRNFQGSVEKVANTWKLSAAPPEALEKLRQYTSKFVADDESQCIVLWSRQSGKNGGAHVELDSGFEGLRQLVQKLNKAPGQRKILLVGDDRNIESIDGTPGDRVQGTKLQGIAAGVNGVEAMGSFWKSDDFKDIWGGDESMQRAGQILLWKELSERKGGKVIHVGMRSGNLETFAMLGMKTVYLEVKGSVSGDRMKAFQEAGLPYTRQVIDSAPTRTGGYADQLSQTEQGGVTGTVIKGKVNQLAREAMTNHWTLMDSVLKYHPDQRKQELERQGITDPALRGRQVAQEFKDRPRHLNLKEALSALPERGQQAKAPKAGQVDPSTALAPHVQRFREDAEARLKAPYAKGFAEGDLLSISNLVDQQLSLEK